MCKYTLNAVAIDVLMDAAFVLVGAGPAALAVLAARLDTVRTRHTANGQITILDQRVAWQFVGLDMSGQAL